MFVAPVCCLALVPATAMANNVTYTSGTTLASESGLNGSVIIDPGSNIVVTNQVTINAEGTNPLPAPGLWVNQGMAVSGPNAVLTLTNSTTGGGQLEVGTTQGSSGAVLISNGGTVSLPNGFAQAGWEEGSSGTITVTGQGSSLNAYLVNIGNGDVSNNLYNRANGVLNIFDGGTVNASNVALGFYDASGVINVSDATLNVSSNLITNIAGSGQVNINNGGVVAVRGQVSMGGGSCTTCFNPQGTINLNAGGTLEVGGTNGIVANEPTNGSYAFNLAGGDLKIVNSDLITNVNMTLVNATNSIIDTNGYTGTFGGALSGAGGLTKVGAGTLVVTGAQTYTGGTTIEAGTLQYGTSGMPLNYNQNVTGPLTVYITPNATPGTGSAQLLVHGAANLSKALVVNLAAPTNGQSYEMGTKYTLVTATGGVTGNFSNISLTGPYARYLTASPLYFNDGSGFQLVASHAVVETSHFYAANGYVQNAALFDALSAPVGTGADYWLHGLGSFGHAPGVNYNYKGFVIGRGFTVNPYLIVGGAVSNLYTHTEDGSESHTNGTNFGAELYSIYTLPRWTITSTGMVGHLGNRSQRYLAGLGTGDSASNGVYAGASVHAAYDLIDRLHGFLTPYLEAGYLHTHMGRGQETGLGFLNASYGKTDTDLAQVGGGLTGGYRVIGDHTVLTAWAGIGGLGTIGNTKTRVDETIGLQNTSVTGQVASTGAVTPAVGLRLNGKTAPWQLGVNWQGQFANRAGGQAFVLKGSYKF